MASFKKRRTIWVPSAAISSLEELSKVRLGKRKVATLAVMIVSGKSDPIGSLSPGTPEKSISMAESIYFSIQTRAKQLKKSVRSTFLLMLSGSISPLATEEIVIGLEIAKSKEMIRSDQFKMLRSGPTTVPTALEASSARVQSSPPPLFSEQAINSEISKAQRAPTQGMDIHGGGVHYF